MKKLEHGKAARRADGPSQTTTFSRRKFFKLGAGGAVLITSLGLGSLGTALLMPGSAKAAKAIEQKKVLGQKLNVVRLGRPLIDLDKETRAYRRGEFFPDKYNKRWYSNSVVIPEEVEMIVTLSQDEKVKRLTVRFPPARDNDPNSRGAGLRGAELHKVARLVQGLTGERLGRVKIILQTGTFDYKGKETMYTNAYILPVDEQGNATTCVGNGQYVAFGASYYADKVYTSIGFLVEPNNHTTMEIASR